MSEFEESKTPTENVPKDFFRNVTYYIVGDISDDVMNLLNAGGAKRDTYLSEMVSHVIADSTEFGEYSEAKELFELPVVTSDWVILSVRCGKLLSKDLFGLEGRVFSGVIACPFRLDEEDAVSVWGMITYHGGRCQNRLDKNVTHLITFTTEGAVYEKAMKHDKIKIVCPDWLTDSISKESKQDEAIYHPRLIEYPKPESPPKPPTPEPEFIHHSLATSPGSGHQIAQQIAAGLRRKSSSDDLPRNGSRPGTPSSSAKEALARMVSNRLQASGKSPEARPVPAPVFPQTHIPAQPQALPQSLPPTHPSNHPQIPLGLMFGHDSHPPNRTLRNITNSAEQAQVPHSARPNTAKIHQILGLAPGQPRPMPSVYPTSPIPPQVMQQMVPPYWGHDSAEKIPPDMCLLGCVFYITDYQKIISEEEIGVWKQVICQHGGQVDSSYSSRVTHLLCNNQHSDVFQLALKDQRRLVTAFWLNDCLIQKKMLPPWQGLHLPSVYHEHKPCNNQIIALTNFDGDERKRIKQMIHAIGAKYTGYLSHTNSVLICKRPDNEKFSKAKEWRIPVVNVQWLTDLVIGNLEALRLPLHIKYLQLGQGHDFNMDLGKVQRLMVGWRTPLKISKEAWKKFVSGPRMKPQPVIGQENLSLKHKLTENDKQEPKSKRQRIAPNGDVTQPQVLFTGYPRGMVLKLQKIVEDLGGVVVDNSRHCTHLVAQILSRTMKFFIAINVCKYIITKEWLEESLIQNRFLDEEKYLLNDSKGEAELGCRLSESLSRSKARPLFQGLTFYVSPGVFPPIIDMKNIIECAGGVLVRRRPSAKTIASQVNEKGHPTFIVITCANDIHLCRDLLAKKIALFNSEFVLTGVLRQEVDFDIFRLEVH